jgi:hypothetical protein
VSLQDLYTEYSGPVQFLAIYIREAHPTDGWYMGNHDIRDPRTIEERRLVAGECEVGMRTYVDGMDDAVMEAYAAWPDRLYLIDVDGRVSYAGGRGPFGFKPAELKEAIERTLADQNSVNADVPR